jgi:hypothetical protein
MTADLHRCPVDLSHRSDMFAIRSGHRFVFSGLVLVLCLLPGRRSAAQVPLVLSDTTTATSALPTSPVSDTTGPGAARQGWVGRFRQGLRTDYPNPRKAIILSLAFPGGGQLYNKRWWKVPFVWGGFVALAYAADYNTRNYRLLRDAYIAELAGEEHPFSGSRLQANDLRRLRDQFDKNKQLSYIGMVGLHLVQAAEAFVDSHLKTFDVSDDLSLGMRPTLLGSGQGPENILPRMTPGIGVILAFR